LSCGRHSGAVLMDTSSLKSATSEVGDALRCEE
jgi:hypothetical protein